MTERAVIVSFFAVSNAPVGRSMTSVVSVFPGQVKRPQPQPQSWGAIGVGRDCAPPEDDATTNAVVDGIAIAASGADWNTATLKFPFGVESTERFDALVVNGEAASDMAAAVRNRGHVRFAAECTATPWTM